MIFSETEGLLESVLVGFEVDSCFKKAILDQELSSFFAAHILSDFDGDVTELFDGAIGLGNS